MLFASLRAVSILSLGALQAGLPVRIVLKDGAFVLRSATAVERVPLTPPHEPQPEPWPPKRLVFRKDAAFAVWDSRGLSVRQRKWVFTTRLAEIPISPKIFSPDEIEQTQAMIAEGRRKLQAATISGAARIGNEVFFLARWEERGGRPWLEALVKVDLNAEKPKPQLLGRLPGTSLDLRPGKSRLFAREGRPAAWVETAEGWGLAVHRGNAEQSRELTIDDLRLTIGFCSLHPLQFFNTSILQHFNSPFDFHKICGPSELIRLGEGRIGWFVERIDYPSQRLFRWDSVTLASRALVETRGTVRLLDRKAPWIAVIHEEGASYLQNLETGARMRLPNGPALRRTSLGVLVWSPDAKPAFAELVETSRWERIGEWQGGAG